MRFVPQQHPTFYMFFLTFNTIDALRSLAASYILYVFLNLVSSYENMAL